MRSRFQSPKPIGILIRVTPEERERLKETLFAEGVTNVSSWLRQVALRKIRQSAGDRAQPAVVQQT